MAGEINPSVAAAIGMIDRHGQPLTIRRKAGDAKLDIATGKITADEPAQEFDIKGVIRNFEIDEANGSSVLIGDLMVLVSALAITNAQGFEPAGGDTIITNDDEEYEVIKPVIPIKRAGDVVAYDLHVRGGKEVGSNGI